VSFQIFLVKKYTESRTNLNFLSQNQMTRLEDEPIFHIMTGSNIAGLKTSKDNQNQSFADIVQFF